MPYAVKRPPHLAKGYIWYVPDLGDNRLDLSDPFRVLMRPLTKRELDQVKANAASLGTTVGASFILQEAVRIAVKEVAALTVEAVETGEVLRPTDGKSLVDACLATDAFNGNSIIETIGAAAHSMSYLGLGELGNLRRQRSLGAESGERSATGPALAAGALTTMNSPDEGTPFDNEGPAIALDPAADL